VSNFLSSSGEALSLSKLLPSSRHQPINSSKSWPAFFVSLALENLERDIPRAWASRSFCNLSSFSLDSSAFLFRVQNEIDSFTCLTAFSSSLAVLGRGIPRAINIALALSSIQPSSSVMVIGSSARILVPPLRLNQLTISSTSLATCSGVIVLILNCNTACLIREVPSSKPDSVSPFKNSEASGRLIKFFRAASISRDNFSADLGSSVGSNNTAAGNSFTSQVSNK